MKLAKLLLWFSVSLFAVHAQADDWIVLGNGGGYAGIPPGPPIKGPFFQTDFDFTCPAGTPGPSKPGYREQLRFDHYGPAGCQGTQCVSTVYLRQDSCGGAPGYFETDQWDLGQVYQVDGGTQVLRYGFNLAGFNGRIYDVLPSAPWPGYMPDRNEAWCRTPVVSWGEDTYEILVTSTAESSGKELSATVYFVDHHVQPPTSPGGPPIQYVLKTLSKVRMARQDSSPGVTFSGGPIQLQIPGGSPGADGQLPANLELKVGGISTQVPVRCYLRQP